MWTRCSTPSPRRPWRPNSAAAFAALLALAACGAPRPAQAQMVVFDPKNHIENALQAARQLESLANEARALANQARELAASPYSLLAETSQTLGDIAELARTVRGVAASAEDLQGQFADLYSTAVEGLDPRTARLRRQARTETARATAEDLARAAAELERLAKARRDRLSGALSASQNAAGQTAAIQSSTQVLALLAEDLGSMRAILLAQSRLMAAETARRAAERAEAAEARRQFWGRDAGTIPNPAFDPYANAKR